MAGQIGRADRGRRAGGGPGKRSDGRMTEDFALVDFALLAAGPERVVQALGQVHALQTLARARARSGAPGGGRHSRPRTGFVSRLLRWPGADADAPPLT